MQDICNHIVTYKKARAEEIIDIGDIVMLDPSTNAITKAVVNSPHDLPINSRLIIGVVTQSDNISKIPLEIDCGNAKSIERKEINCGNSEDKPEFIIIEGGTSKINARAYVKLAYTGEVNVNICGFVQLGDKLTLSNHPGKAKAINYMDKDYYESRSIGKVIKFVSDKQVKVLLNIE